MRRRRVLPATSSRTSAVRVSEQELVRRVTELGARQRSSLPEVCDRGTGQYALRIHTARCPRIACGVACREELYIVDSGSAVDYAQLLDAMGALGARYVRAVRKVVVLQRSADVSRFASAWSGSRRRNTLELARLPLSGARAYLCATHGPACLLVKQFELDRSRVVCDSRCSVDLLVVPLDSPCLLSQLVALRPTSQVIALHGTQRFPLQRRVCGVCYDETRVAARSPTECASCGVYTCVKCYARWLLTQVDNGNANSLRCTCCNAPVPNGHVAKYCSRDVAIRYAYYCSRIEQRANEFAIWCSNESCRALLHDLPVRVDRQHLVCSQCASETCAGCHLATHHGSRCLRPVESVGRRLRSKVWHRAYAKRCPGCNVWIQKNGGCSQMRCSQCRIVFCYRCRRLYRHESDGTVRGDCACSRIAEAGLIAAALTMMAVVVPVTVAAALVAGPPLGIAYAVSPRQQKEKMKSKMHDMVEALKELEDDRFEGRGGDSEDEPHAESEQRRSKQSRREDHREGFVSVEPVILYTGDEETALDYFDGESTADK